MTTYEFKVAPAPIRHLLLQTRLISLVCAFCLLRWGVLALSYGLFSSSAYSQAWIWIPMGLLCSVWALFNLGIIFLPARILNRWIRFRGVTRFGTWLLLGIVAGWEMAFEHYILSVFILVFLIALIGLFRLEKLSLTERIIRIDEEGFHISGLLRYRFYPWSACNEVILHNGLMTLDLKTNQVIQIELMDNQEAAREEEFRTFSWNHLSST